MIRLYLNKFTELDCATLYNGLHVALASVPVNSKAYRDIESAMDYLAGYSDALQNVFIKKEGVNQCRHV